MIINMILVAEHTLKAFIPKHNETYEVSIK